MKKYLFPALLFLVLALALALRLYGLDWDGGHLYHPDERAILMKVWELSPPHSLGEFLSKDSPLNPEWFSYGSFPLYLLKFSGAIASRLDPDLARWDLRLVGRVLSALFDTGTLILLFFLGRRLYNRKVGLLAAAFGALAVIHIQLSHFFAVDTLLAFFTVLTLFALAGVVKGRGIGSAALAGFALALALATKASAALLAFPLIAAYILYLLPGKGGIAASPGRARRGLALFLITIGVGVVTFLIAQPYAILDLSTFLKDVARESEMARRVVDFPYTRQYINTPPYLYHVQQLALFGLGLPLGVAAWAGLAFTLFLAWKKKDRGDILLLSWVVTYFLIVGSFQVKFLRYMLPLTPALFLLGARMVFSLEGVGKAWARPLAWGAIGVVLLFSAFYSLAFLSLYSRPHPANEMSRWIQAQAPPGSYILMEHWEEEVPGLDSYVKQILPLYDPDDPAKEKLLVEALEKADYIIFYSNRLYGTISRLPERYPLTSRYYQALFSGELGFDLASFEASYPGLLGLTFKDDTLGRPGLPRPPPIANYRPSPLTLNLGYADESFTVYDHPLVLLFQKARPLSGEELSTALAPGAPPPVEGDTWAELFPLTSWRNRLPILAWLLAVEGISLLFLPLGLWLFSSLADRGYLLTKALAILMASYIPWLASSLRLAPFSPTTILAGLALGGAVSLGVGLAKRRELASFLRQKRRLILLEEAVFLGAFALSLGLRLWNPDLWHPYRGGEKPMELAYLNAVVKSRYMPPYDPWFSGGQLNYYYYGQFLIANLIKLTGIVPTTAFNLAIPLLFALTAGAAFSLGYNLSAAFRKSGKWWPYLGAGAAVVFLVLMGNLDGLAQEAQGIGRMLRGAPFPAFDYWRSTRMMPPDPPGFEITEFPFFSFLFADLHAHLIALPFTLLATGLALGVMTSRSRRPWLLGALALTLGALRIINTWDFPTYFLIAAGAVAIGEYLPRRRLDLALGFRVLLSLALVYGLSTLFYLPFHQNYQQFYSGVEFSRTKTELWQYLAIQGFFLFLLTLFLGVEISSWVAQSSLGHFLRLVRRFWRKRARFFSLCQALVHKVDGITGIGVFSFLLLFLIGMALLIFQFKTVTVLYYLILLILALLFRELLFPPAPRGSYLAALGAFALALAIGLGVDLLTLKGDIERMNTVFKFYLQAWALLSLASAYALVHLISRKSLSRVVIGPLALLLAAGLVYPFAATPVRARDRFQPLPPTLDGAAYMKDSVYHDAQGDIELKWDYQAIRWLQEKIKGSPVILEAVTPEYRWGGRVSIYTGLPTVLGWNWHQRQQRWGYQEKVWARQDDVNFIYSTRDPSAALSILKKYGVSYIYVGPVERLYYPSPGLAKFEEMVGGNLVEVYSNPEVKIYRITTPP